MTPEQFAESVAVYCTAVGAGIGVKEHLIANYRVIVGAWKVTHRDLGEIAYRLVRDKRIPNWPKEHSEAIGREVDIIRREKLAAMRPERTEHACPVCEGIGLVVVPHPCCVHDGRVTGYYDHRARIRRRDVVTISVVCTAPKCWAGERAAMASREYADDKGRAKLLTMDRYLRRVGLSFEPTIALREWEAAQEAKARDACPRGKGERDVYRSLVGSIIAQHQAWAEQPYRDPAEVDENEAIPA